MLSAIGNNCKLVEKIFVESVVGHGEAQTKLKCRYRVVLELEMAVGSHTAIVN